MKHLLNSIVLISVTTVLLSSCVAKRKFVAATRLADKEHADNVALQNQLQDKENQLQDKENAIGKLKGKVNELGDANQNTTNQLNMTKDQVAAQRKRLEQLQMLIDQQQKKTEALRKTIADALVNFNTNELTVSMKNGKVYVSMQESLLFPSGSAVVNPKGKEALSKLAAVLNTNSNINVDVEGHTDSIAIHNMKYADNWALSTARATSIAHVLIDEYRVNPTRIVASGRSQYDPIADNGTIAGRAQNRRTEIILEPKLDELMQVINGSNTIK